MSAVLENVNGHEYNGVWKLWKLGSLGLFGVFVAILWDVSRTMRKIEEGVNHPVYEIGYVPTPFDFDENNIVEIGSAR